MKSLLKVVNAKNVQIIQDLRVMVSNADLIPVDLVSQFRLMELVLLIHADQHRFKSLIFA